MAGKALACSEPDDQHVEPVRLRLVSPDITEVLHLIGALERLVDDVKERHTTMAVAPAD